MTRNLQAIPDFDLYDPFSPGFARARQGVQTPWAKYDFALDSLNTGSYLNFAGDVFYIDPVSTGFASVDFNIQQSAPQAPMLVQSGFVLHGIFTGLTMSWTAQPGKMIRVMVATGQRVIPATVSSSAVTSWTAPQVVGITESGANYGASYQSAATLAALTPDNIISAAGNVNGYVLWAAQYMGGNQSTNFSDAKAFVAKATAPAFAVDGDTLALSRIVAISGANVAYWCELQRTVRVAAGKRLDRISSLLEVAGIQPYAHAKWTLL